MRLVDSTRFAAALAQARADLASLHECEVCAGCGWDLAEGVPPDRKCPTCGGTGRWDEREPLARMVVELAEVEKP